VILRATGAGSGGSAILSGNAETGCAVNNSGGARLSATCGFFLGSDSFCRSLCDGHDVELLTYWDAAVWFHNRHAFSEQRDGGSVDLVLYGDWPLKKRGGEGSALSLNS
jgi:hypothetical protein